MRPRKRSATDLEPGSKFGRYVIEQTLGRGGMGTVYAALDSQLGRRVALKVPHFGPEDDGSMRARFYREARAAATLHHPNLCPVHDVGEVDGVHYLTMALVHGTPLSKYRGQQLAQHRAAALVRTLAFALADAHDAGVTHRDLKPSNIMLDAKNRPIIMDFGLALHTSNKEAVRLTQIGVMMGTPAYMPPEQVRGDLSRQGPCCDIYSLGVILYELLAGRLPFEAPALTVLALILTTEPQPPSTYRPDLDLRLEDICRQAMQKNPEDRFADMREFGTALEVFLKSPLTPPTRRPSHSTAGSVDSMSLDETVSRRLDTTKRRTHRKRSKRSDQAKEKSPFVIDGNTILLAAAGVCVLLGLLVSLWRPAANLQEQPAVANRPAGQANEQRPAFPLPNWLPRVQVNQNATQNNLHMVGGGLHQFHDTFGFLPVNGVNPKGDEEMPHSWMTRLLPYLQHANVYGQVDFKSPWSAATNQPAFSVPIPEYQSPFVRQTHTADGRYAVAHYAGNTLLFGVDETMQLRGIRDGLANTIAAGEAAGQFEPWANQQNLRDTSAGINVVASEFGSPRGDGAYFLFADGTVRFIPNDIDPHILRAATTPSGAEPFTQAQLR